MSSRVALVIGIGQYEHHTRLEYCPPSAHEVYNLLTSSKYGQCDPKRSKIITDNEVHPLTDIKLYSIIRDTIADLEFTDQFVFFYTGHGEVLNGSLFLTTNNSGEPQQGYRFSQLVQNLQDQGIISAILIVDACYSEAMFNSIKNLQGGALPLPPRPRGFGFIAACRKSERAQQDPNLSQTVFSYLVTLH